MSDKGNERWTEVPTLEIADGKPRENDDSDCHFENNSVVSNDSEDSVIEPFDDYKEKIQALCSHVGFVDFEVEVIQHGYSYQNCVYSLTSTSDCTQAYILRVLQCPSFRDSDGLCEELMDEIATLEYLRKKLPVPRVKCYDLFEDNHLGKPYIIQTRITGVSLSKLYEKMTHSEKIIIINQVIEMMVKLESVQFPNAGNLKCKDDLPSPRAKDYTDWSGLTVELFDSRFPVDDPETDPARLHDRQGVNLKTLIRSLLEGWTERVRNERIIDLERQGKFVQWDDELSSTLPTFKRLLGMLQDLDNRSVFKDQPFPIVLHHWDFEPRNILVENSSGTWKISGIIDWDEAEAVPRLLARKPPVWMWDFSEEPAEGFLNSDQHPDPELDEKS